MLSALLTLLVAPTTLPQEPVVDTLVLDINTATSFGDTFDPEPLAVGNLGDGRLLFTARAYALDDRAYWVTDGTPLGTLQLFPGGLPLLQPSAPLDIDRDRGAALPDGRIVFAGSIGFNSGFAQVSDGTSAGTLALPDASPFQNTPGPRRFTAHQDEVWYLAHTDVGTFSDLDLFATDGSIAGTTKRVELDLQGGGFAHDDVVVLASDGPGLLIAHSRIEGTDWLTDLWRSGGTQGSTELFATLSGRVAPGDSGQRFGARLVVLLGADEDSPARDLWAVDLANGALELLAAGPPLAFVRGDSEQLFFASGLVGSQVLNYGEPGSPGTTLGSFRRLSNLAAGELPSDVALVDGVLLFGAEGIDTTTGLEPWRSDGTGAGTRLLFDLEPGSGSSQPHGFLAQAGEGKFGAVTSSAGAELYRTTGQPGDVELVADLTPGPEGGLDPGRMVASAGSTTVFGYRFESVGAQLAATTTGGADLIAKLGSVLNQGSNPRALFAYQERLIFSTFTTEFGFEPWTSDGTAAGTELFLDLHPGPGSSTPDQWTEFQGRLFFTAFTIEHGREIWSTDGSPGGTMLLVDSVPGSVGAVSDLTASDDWLFFISQDFGDADRIWRTDGTAAGTSVIPDLSVPAPQSARVLHVFGDTALVHAEDTSPGAPALGRELYLVDAVTAERELLVDYNAGPFNSTLPFFASTEDFTLSVLKVPGTRLIVSDGTLAGSGELTSPDFPPSLFDTTIYGAWEDLVFFATGNGDFWSTDGTTAGTQLIDSANLFGGGVNQFDGRGEFAVLRDSVRRLWRTDGTPAGTFVIAEPMSPFGNAFQLRAPAGTEGAYLYVDSTPQGGDELWITDGSVGSERQFSDSGPGPVDGIGGELARVGSLVFFAGQDGVTGSELHVAPFAATSASVIQPFGAGCSNTSASNTLGGSGPAVLGGTLEIELSDAVPGATALLFRSPQFGATDLGAGCTLFATQPVFTAALAIDGVGFGAAALPIPDAPALVGLRLALQAAVTEPAGPFAQAFGVSGALEVLLGP